MPRVKRGIIKKKKKNNLLKHVKGFKWGRKNKYKAAKEAMMKAWTYQYRDRKTKKRELRKRWQIKIGAACKENGISYNSLIHGLKKKNIILDRKILALFVKDNPETFNKIVKEIK